MADACLVYVTASDRAEAERMAEAVVGERLAACANILGDIDAVFFWAGATQRESETAMLFKTTMARLDALTACVRRLHSYDEPCVVALPIIGGSQGFLDWISTETQA